MALDAVHPGESGEPASHGLCGRRPQVFLAREGDGRPDPRQDSPLVGQASAVEGEFAFSPDRVRFSWTCHLKARTGIAFLTDAGQSCARE